MKTYLWSVRYNHAKGYHWKLERECVNTGNEWLTVFKNAEPTVLFVLSQKMPSKKTLTTLLQEFKNK